MDRPARVQLAQHEPIFARWRRMTPATQDRAWADNGSTVEKRAGDLVSGYVTKPLVSDIGQLFPGAIEPELAQEKVCQSIPHPLLLAPGFPGRRVTAGRRGSAARS